MGFKFNPFIGNFDVDNDSGGGTTIPEYATDPVSPSAEDVWVLRTDTADGTAGSPRGLLLSLTYTGNMLSSSYQLSYRTAAGTTIRTTMT